MVRKKVIKYQSNYPSAIISLNAITTKKQKKKKKKKKKLKIIIK